MENKVRRLNKAVTEQKEQFKTEKKELESSLQQRAESGLTSKLGIEVPGSKLPDINEPQSVKTGVQLADLMSPMTQNLDSECFSPGKSFSGAKGTQSNFYYKQDKDKVDAAAERLIHSVNAVTDLLKANTKLRDNIEKV